MTPEERAKRLVAQWDLQPKDGFTTALETRIALAIREAEGAARGEEREACANHIDVPWSRPGSEFAAAIRDRKE